MAANQLDWGVEEVVIKQKKLSREERKIEQAIRLIDKIENNHHRTEPKPKPHQNPSCGQAKPRKKVKVDAVASEKPASTINTAEFESSSASEQQLPKDRSKPSNIINSLYLNSLKEDLYSHLLDYTMAERSKYIDTITSEKIDLDTLQGTQEGVKMLPPDVFHKTSNAFSKIQNKFSELRSKLVRPSSKDHKEFITQYLNVDFLNK